MKENYKMFINLLSKLRGWNKKMHAELWKRYIELLSKLLEWFQKGHDQNILLLQKTSRSKRCWFVGAAE